MTLIEQIEKWDRELLFAINGAHSEFFDGVMWWVSEPVFGVPFYLFFAFLFYKYYGLKNALIMVLAVGIAVGLSDLAAKHLFKEVFERYRPSHNLEIKHLLHFVNGEHGGTYGFVSSHAANMFSIATITGLLLLRKLKYFIIPALLWAALIGYSRIYLGVHYPSDVFGGAMLGAFIGILVYQVVIKSKLVNFST